MCNVIKIWNQNFDYCEIGDYSYDLDLYYVFYEYVYFKNSIFTRIIEKDNIDLFYYNDINLTNLKYYLK